MNFLHPEILYVLLLLVIPVIIHLFHFKKFRPVYFSQIEFLKELKKESSTKNRLKEWLLLLMRVLAMACIIMVFAWPYIPTDDSNLQAANSISLYIDNSFSSEAENEQGKIIDLEKNIARELIHSFNESDEFQIISNNFESKNLKFYTKETAIKLVDEIELTSSSLNLDELRTVQNNSNKLHANFPVSTFLISDFQKSQFQLESLSKKKEERLFLAPVTNQNKKNISIQRAYLNKPFIQQSQQIDLVLVLQNHSQENYDGLNVKLFNNGKIKSSRSIDIAKRDSSIVHLSFPSDDSDFQEISIQINDSPIGFDNNYYLTLTGLDKLKIAYIYKEKHNYFTKLFNQNEFEFKSFAYTQIPYSELNNFDLIILDEITKLNSGLIESITKAFKGSSNICLIPSSKADIRSYNQLLLAINQGVQYQEKEESELEILKLSYDHPLFQEVFKSKNKDINKPSTKYNYPIVSQSLQAGSSALILQNGQPFLWSNTGNGNYCFILSTDLSEGSNLEKHALFVPTFYNMSFLKEKTQKLQYTLGSDQLIRLKNNSRAEKMTLNLNNQSYFPTFKQMESGFYIEIGNDFKEEGIYSLIQENKTIAKIGFNYPRKESDLQYYNEEELKSFIANHSDSNIKLLEYSKDSFIKEITQQFTGKILWPYFLALSLLFLIFEISLIKIRPYENSNS